MRHVNRTELFPRENVRQDGECNRSKVEATIFSSRTLSGREL